MMPSEHDAGQHALLSPSAAHRWIACPASVHMSAQVPEPPESTYAAEGTLAHAVAEFEARAALVEPMAADAYVTARTALGGDDEMHSHALGYVNLLRELREQMPYAGLLLEQRLPTGVPSCWGTSDAVLVSPDEIVVVDYKYGRGVQVEAPGNPQLRLYGVGALEAFGDLLGEVRTVTMVVHQPRLGHRSAEILSAADLRAWRDGLIPVAEVALGQDAPFGPSEEACRWCPASGQCVAQKEWALARDFTAEPKTMSVEALAEALEAIPAIEAWCAAVREFALNRIYSRGLAIPGWKVVRTNGRRVIADSDGALAALQAIGFTLDQVAKTKLNGIGELEKLLGADFDVALSAFVSKTEGNPALVPESDRRPSITPNTDAAAVFASAEIGDAS